MVLGLVSKLSEVQKWIHILLRTYPRASPLTLTPARGWTSPHTSTWPHTSLSTSTSTSASRHKKPGQRRVTFFGASFSTSSRPAGLAVDGFSSADVPCRRVRDRSSCHGLQHRQSRGWGEGCGLGLGVSQRDVGSWSQQSFFQSDKTHLSEESPHPDDETKYYSNPNTFCHHQRERQPDYHHASRRVSIGFLHTHPYTKSHTLGSRRSWKGSQSPQTTPKNAYSLTLTYTTNKPIVPNAHKSSFTDQDPNPNPSLNPNSKTNPNPNPNPNPKPNPTPTPSPREPNPNSTNHEDLSSNTTPHITSTSSKSSESYKSFTRISSMVSSLPLLANSRDVEATRALLDNILQQIIPNPTAIPTRDPDRDPEGDPDRHPDRHPGRHPDRDPDRQLSDQLHRHPHLPDSDVFADDGYEDRDSLCSQADVHSMIQCATKIQAWDQAIRLASAFPNALQRNPKLATMVIDSLVSQREYIRALQFFHSMQHQQLPQDATTYTAIIPALDINKPHHNSKAWIKVMGILHEMLRKGIKPTSVICNAVMRVLLKHRHWDKAVQLFDSMQAKRLTPDDATWHLVLTACSRGGQWERAISLLDRLPALSTLTLTTVISACARANEWRMGFEILDAMRRTIGLECVLDPSRIRSSNPAENPATPGQRILDRIIQEGLHSLSTLNTDSLGPSLGSPPSLDNPSSSSNVASLAKPYPNAYTYNAVISSLIESNKTQISERWRSKLAYTLVQRLMSEQDTHPEHALDSLVFNSAIHVCVENGGLKSALLLFEDMQRLGYNPDKFTLASLIRGAGARRWQLALALFETYANPIPSENLGMENASSGMENPSSKNPSNEDSGTNNLIHPDKKLYFAVIDACETANASTQADVLYQQMASQGALRLKMHVNKYRSQTTVDMHTLTVPVARCAMRDVLRQVASLPQSRIKDLGDLHIIVGRGQKTGKSLLGPAMVDEISREISKKIVQRRPGRESEVPSRIGARANITSMSVHQTSSVSVSVSDTNQGRIVLTQSHLQAWLGHSPNQLPPLHGALGGQRTEPNQKRKATSKRNKPWAGKSKPESSEKSNKQAGSSKQKKPWNR